MANEAKQEQDKSVDTVKAYVSAQAERYGDDVTINGALQSIGVLSSIYPTLDQNAKKAMWTSIQELERTVQQQVETLGRVEVRSSQLTFSIGISRAYIEFIAGTPVKSEASTGEGKRENKWTKGIKGYVDDIKNIKDNHELTPEVTAELDNISTMISDLNKAVDSNNFDRRSSILSDLVSACLV